MAKAASPPSFALVARRAGQRVFWRRVLAMARRLAAPAVLAAALVGWFFGVAVACAAVLLPWCLASLWQAMRLPRAGYDVLALWDRAAGRREDFAAAWWVESQLRRTPQQDAHLQRQRQLLESALSLMPSQLPLGWSWALLLPLLVLPMVELLRLLPEQINAPAALQLDVAQRARLEQELSLVAKRLVENPDLEGLEAPQLGQLKQALSKAQEALAKGQGRQGREALTAAESAAHALEKAAGDLISGAGQWASEQLIEAMRAQVATADLGDALAQRKAAVGANSAQALADALGRREPSVAQVARIAAALREIQPAAQPQDANNLAGSRVTAAAKAMAEAKRGEASGQFAALAATLQQQAAAQRSGEALEKLAQRLRQAGDRSAELAKAGDAAEARAAAGAGAGEEVGKQGAMAEGKLAQAQNLPMLESAPSGPPQPQGAQGEGQAALFRDAAKSGQQPTPSGPKLFAPIPGLDPEQSKQAMLMEAPEGAKGKPQGVVAMPAGQRAGRGPGPTEQPAEAMEQARQAALSAVVDASAGREGESSRRSVRGGQKQGEQASAVGREAAIRAVDAQERALDEAVLPLERREQVRRYFQELRRRLEVPTGS